MLQQDSAHATSCRWRSISQRQIRPLRKICRQLRGEDSIHFRDAGFARDRSPGPSIRPRQGVRQRPTMADKKSSHAKRNPCYQRGLPAPEREPDVLRRCARSSKNFILVGKSRRFRWGMNGPRGFYSSRHKSRLSSSSTNLLSQVPRRIPDRCSQQGVSVEPRQSHISSGRVRHGQEPLLEPTRVIDITSSTQLQASHLDVSDGALLVRSVSSSSGHDIVVERFGSTQRPTTRT